MCDQFKKSRYFDFYTKTLKSGVYFTLRVHYLWLVKWLECWPFRSRQHLWRVCSKKEQRNGLGAGLEVAANGEWVSDDWNRHLERCDQLPCANLWLCVRHCFMDSMSPSNNLGEASDLSLPPSRDLIQHKQTARVTMPRSSDQPGFFWETLGAHAEAPGCFMGHPR